MGAASKAFDASSFIIITMTASDILNVITTVAVTQLLVDLACRWMVFGGEPYKRSLSQLERAKERLNKCKASLDINALGTKQEKQAKKLQRHEEDCNDAAGDVARRHAIPGFFGSIVFLILYRVFSLEYSSRVVGVIPWVPPRLLRKLTMRGLTISAAIEDTEYNVYQACSFLFVYILCTLSIKFYVHKIVGVQAPKEASGGLMTIMDSPSNKKMLKNLGIDTDAYKME